jgi:hypothetical protein
MRNGAGMGDAVCVLLRVWLPDRPGALGAVASRIGSVRGDIVGIDVLERNQGVAIDEFGVILPDADILPLLVREVEEVDGSRVEHVAVVNHFPDPRLDALVSVALVCEADNPAALQAALTTYAGCAFLADWVVLLDGDGIVDSWGAPPSEEQLAVLAKCDLEAPPGDAGEGGSGSLAVARRPHQGAVLLVGRADHEFRAREQAQLVALTRIADRVWSRLAEEARCRPHC